MKYLLILFVLVLALTQCVRNSNSCPTLVHTCRENATNTMDKKNNTNKSKRAAATTSVLLSAIDADTLNTDDWARIKTLPASG